MPDKRTHRGPHPADGKLFGPPALGTLRAALADFCGLLTKGYAEKSALKLVGDHFALTQRQRLALMRSACSDQQLQSRKKTHIPVETLAAHPIAIDGYNLLITIEAAMSGGFIFQGRDGCFRDLAGIHGTYRKVSETVPALTLIGQFLQEIDAAGVEGVPPSNRRQDARDTTAPAEILWLLDSPVSNSGRLKTLMSELAAEKSWKWQIRLLTNPDAELKQTDRIVATSDSVVLDAARRWTNLAEAIIQQRLPESKIVDLRL